MYTQRESWEEYTAEMGLVVPSGLCIIPPYFRGHTLCPLTKSNICVIYMLGAKCGFAPS